MVHHDVIIAVGRLESTVPIPPVKMEFDSKKAANAAAEFIRGKGFDCAVVEDDENADDDDTEVEEEAEAA